MAAYWSGANSGPPNKCRIVDGPRRAPKQRANIKKESRMANTCYTDCLTLFCHESSHPEALNGLVPVFLFPNVLAREQ